MRFLITYICLFTFILSCPASYVGYIGKAPAYKIFSKIGIGSQDNIELKEEPQPIYTSNYGEKDESRRVVEADYETFTISGIDVDYAFDKNHVYYKGKVIEGIDTHTHKVISTETNAGLKSDGFVSDKNGLYYYGQKLDGVESDDYKKIGYYIIANGAVYAKDKKTNYDLESFEVIINGAAYSMCNDLIEYRDTLTKDKNSVYVNDINIYDLNYYNKKKLNIDVETFRRSSNYLFEDKNNYYVSRNEVRYLINEPLIKKYTITYYRIDYLNNLEPFLLINNNNLFQLMYSYNYNVLKNKNLKLEDMEIYALHNNIVLLNFKNEIYTLTEKFLMSKNEIEKIYFSNPQTVVLKSKDKVVVYPSSRVKIYTKEHGIDINSLIYIEPDESLDIKMEYMETGVFIDKKNMYNSELKKVRTLKKNEYRNLKKYKKEFEDYRLKTLDNIIIKK